jgi:predicted PurR-regulated permease PerM|tara:strand:- start:32 stop:1015 length:984 start_codon:yes stop_codon:yes gene_type:complete
MKIRADKKELRKYLFFGIIFILIFLSFKIIQPYLIILISAFILSYLIRPLYLKMNSKLSKSLSAITCILLIVLLIFLPLGGIIGGITNQAYALIEGETISSLSDKLSLLPFIENFNFDVGELIQKGTLFLVSLLVSSVSHIPSLIISLIVLLFGIYYILIEWDVLAYELRHYLPFKDKNKISKGLNVSTKGIVYGSLLIAIIEFAVSGIGFFLSGVNLYFLLPSLIFFFAFIPGLGPTVVWVPLALYYFFVGNWFTMTGVIIVGIILSLYVDTVLRTKILGGKAKINPFIMLVGILGGISLFGIFGFIIGPLILVYTIMILRELVIE